MNYEIVFLLIVVFFLYFLPALAGKHQLNANKIVWINLFFGWTIIGWIIALAMAMEKEKVVSS